MMIRFAGLCVVLLCAAGLYAEDAGQWSSVQGLRKGDRVGVILTSQKRVEGAFESATDSRITLQADQAISLEKADVVRVYKTPRHGRLFGAVIGGVAGVAVGGLMDATVGQRFRNEGPNPAKGLLTGVGAAVGVGIGAAASGGYRTIYRR